MLLLKVGLDERGASRGIQDSERRSAYLRQLELLQTSPLTARVASAVLLSARAAGFQRALPCYDTSKLLPDSAVFFNEHCDRPKTNGSKLLK